MHRIAIGLSALLLIAATGTPGATQDLNAKIAAPHEPDCGYVCVYADSLVAASDREHGQPQFVELRAAPATRTPQLSVAPERAMQASPTIASSRQ